DRVTIMKGDIAEVLIYNRALTADERRALVVYLNQKYLYGNIDPAGDLDQDGLTNLEEENLLTDLNNPDTDGDGVSDGDEVHKYKSNPLSTDTRDPIGGQIHDALFTGDSVDGVTVVASQVADNWNKNVNFGDSPEQQVLSSVLSSIRWSDALNAMDDQDHRAVTVTLSKLQ